MILGRQGRCKEVTVANTDANKQNPIESLPHI